MEHFAKKIDLRLWKTSGQPGVTPGHFEAVTAVVEVDIDVDAIMRRLGARALSNRNGQSKFMDGFVTVRARKV